MRTPKELFHVSGFLASFKEVVKADCFESACEYALMQLQSELPPTVEPGTPTDPYIGLDANSQLQGARRVLTILKSLHEHDKKSEPPKRDRLNYANP